MRFLLLFLIPFLMAAGETGYVNLRADLMKVPEKAVKEAPEKALEYNGSARVMSVYLNVLHDTRAETRLRTSVESNETGLVFSLSPKVHVPGKSAQVDFNAYYRMPPGGVFGASGAPGFNDAVGFSTRRILRMPRPSASGLFRLPEGGAIVPLLTVYTQYPMPGILTHAKEAEIRLISADTGELKRFSDNPLIEPLLRDYVLDKIAAYPHSFQQTLNLRSKRALYNRTTPFTDPVSGRRFAVGLRIQVTEFAPSVFRLSVEETLRTGTRKSSGPEHGEIPVFETFSYDGFLSAQPGKWIMPVRIVSAHAGRRSFYETDFTERTREKVLMIRFR